MKRKGVFPAINIQWPISEKILTKEKSIETRTYPLPTKYENKKLLFIETPGKSGGFKARIVGFIVFEKSYSYENSKNFYSESHKHLVTPRSLWAWDNSKPKYGWVIKEVEIFDNPKPAPTKRGIVFTKQVKL